MPSEFSWPLQPVMSSAVVMSRSRPRPQRSYLASVWPLNGRHQLSLAWYHCTVANRSASKSSYVGSQPSSWRSLPLSIA